jgi:hypothetical protein
MEPGVSLPRSQDIDTCHYEEAEPDQFSLHPPTLFIYSLFQYYSPVSNGPSSFLNKNCD